MKTTKIVLCLTLTVLAVFIGCSIVAIWNHPEVAAVNPKFAIVWLSLVCIAILKVIYTIIKM